MRKIALLVVLMTIPFVAGCAMSDALFSVFGDYYSDGGTTPAEKKYHYDRQVDAWDNYDRYGTPP